MKTAVISDLHGNMQALQSVLDDISAQGCEKILCLGDLAMAGPQPRFVIDFVSRQKDWEVIQGNTDKIIAEFNLEILEEVKSKYPIMANALLDDILFIEDARKEFLGKLPPQKELEIEGVKVLMVHGSPRRNNEDILPNRPIEEIEEIIAGTSADLILCGHTHLPCGYQTNSNQTVVNAGSVGRPMNAPRACYALINFENGSFTVQHKFVSYDKETAALIMRARDFEGSGKIAEMILRPTQRHI